VCIYIYIYLIDYEYFNHLNGDENMARTETGTRTGTGRIPNWKS